jgi:WD40 repeat protein
MSRGTCCAYAPDGSTFATGDSSGGLTLWNAATGRPIKTLGEPKGSVACLAYTPDGRRLVSLVGHGIHVWDVSSGQEVTSFGIKVFSESMALLPDGKTVAVAWDKVFLYDLETGASRGELVAARPTHGPQPEWVYSYGVNSARVVASADGKLLVEGQGDGWLFLWDLASREQIDAIPASVRGYFGVAISPDAKTLAWRKGGSVVLYDLAARREIGTLAAGQVTGLAFSHDGALLGGMGTDGLARMWDVKACQEKWNVRTGQDDFGLSFGGGSQ